MQNRNFNLSYTDMPDLERAKSVDSLMWLFREFLTDNGYPRDVAYFCSIQDLMDAIIRVDKREAYYHCFHGMEINEKKRAALYAYWILKFRPFKITDGRFWTGEQACVVNESFAIYLVCSVLFYSKKRFSAVSKTEQGTFYQKLIYAFRYRDISIDSMLLLVESINAETFNIQDINTV